MGLTPADRRLLFGALALMLLMTVFTAALAPSVAEEQSSIPSSYSASPGGALAAYSLLAQLHYPISRWEEPPARLPHFGLGNVLILAEPAGTPTLVERARLHDFVAGGGRILFCGPSIRAFFPEAAVDESKVSPSGPLKTVEVSPVFPSQFTAGARKVRLQPQSPWKATSPSQVPLYQDESGTLILVWRIGDGELLWWTSASPLTNAGIDQADNLTLLLDAVGPQTEPSGRRVYWDEYFHGGRGTLWSYVERTPLKWAFAQCALLTFAVIFAFSRRSGPVAELRPISRLSPLEFVETLGGLYQRAGATSVPASVAYRHLHLALTRRLRLPAALSDSDLAQAAEQRLGWDRAEIASLLERAADANAVRPKEALELVQTLGNYLHRLLDSTPAMEKK